MMVRTSLILPFRIHCPPRSLRDAKATRLSAPPAAQLSTTEWLYPHDRHFTAVECDRVPRPPRINSGNGPLCCDCARVPPAGTSTHCNPRNTNFASGGRGFGQPILGAASIPAQRSHSKLESYALGQDHAKGGKPPQLARGPLFTTVPKHSTLQVGD
jgi:hypothetical protein